MLMVRPSVNVPRRMQAAMIVVLLAAGILLQRLFVVQIVEGEKHAQSLINQTTIPILLPPPRGLILDRNGLPLAENRARYDVDLYVRELSGNYARAHRGRLPMTLVEVGVGEKRRKQRQVDIDRIVQETAAEPLRNLGIQMNYEVEDLRRHANQRPNTPFQLATQIDFATLSRMAERDPRIPGVDSAARPVRWYPQGAMASHVLGWCAGGKNSEKKQPGVHHGGTGFPSPPRREEHLSHLGCAYPDHCGGSYAKGRPRCLRRDGSQDRGYSGLGVSAEF